MPVSEQTTNMFGNSSQQSNPLSQVIMVIINHIPQYGRIWLINIFFINYEKYI